MNSLKLVRVCSVGGKILVHQQFIQYMEKLPDDAWKKLIKVTHDCVGCGLCTKVCPSGSMQMEKGKAVHISEKYQTCLACIHNCPYKALTMDMPEKIQMPDIVTSISAWRKS